MSEQRSSSVGRILWIDKRRMLVMMDGKDPVENRPENGDLKYTVREVDWVKHETTTAGGSTSVSVNPAYPLGTANPAYPLGGSGNYQ